MQSNKLLNEVNKITEVPYEKTNTKKNITSK